MLAEPFHTKVLHHGLKVQHLLNVARNELTDFVNDEHEAVAWPAAFHERGGSLGEFTGGNVGTLLDAFHP